VISTKEEGRMGETLIKGREGAVVGTMYKMIIRTIDLKTPQESISPGVKSYVWDTD